MQKKNYVQEILDIIRSGLPQAELAEKLSDYHENDLADALTALTPEERQKVYTALGVDTVAEIFSYLDDAEPYLKELDPERAARVISHMDSDDAVDALDDLEEDDKAKIVHQLDKDAADDVKLLLSYHEDEIGSCMTTNYICIRRDMTIRQAMSELVKQAGENDNISTLYVVDENEHFYGAIDLKDLIVARAEERLEKLIEDLFGFTKMNYGKLAMHVSKVDIVKLLGQLLEESYPNFANKGLSYELQSNVPAKMITADGNLLARLFDNLIGNAIKYGAEGKRILVKVMADTDEVQVSVTNYGYVIPAEELPLIFDKFYRVEQSRSTHTGGTGLGLSIVKHGAIYHKAKVELKSALGEGTTVRIVF